MPTYDLKCQNCGYEFSAFCKISEKDKQLCPECGSNKLNTLFRSFNKFSSIGIESVSPNSSPPSSSGFG